MTDKKVNKAGREKSAENKAGNQLDMLYSSLAPIATAKKQSASNRVAQKPKSGKNTKPKKVKESTTTEQAAAPKANKPKNAKTAKAKPIKETREHKSNDKAEKNASVKKTNYNKKNETKKTSAHNAHAKNSQNNQKNSGGKQNSQNKKNGKKNRRQLKPSIKAYFLGGLNEIGKNFTVFECEDDMIIVDCGLSFPDEEMPGIDAVIPVFTFVEQNRDKIRALFITHGHEDHIGSVPYLLQKINVPVYGTALTLGLVESKLREFGLDRISDLRVYPAGSRIKAGCFTVEFIHVNHSIADSVALAIHSPAGTLVHTGDFKIDLTPVEGETTDLHRFAELGKEGVLALMADSTNAERPGFTQTEQKVNATLDSMFLRAGKKRIIVATFASSISRVQMIIDCAAKYGRKVALSGRSMVNVVGIASELGYMNVPDGIIVDLSMINRYTDDKLVLITTGSQGEPMSALTRMANAEHRQVEVGKNDFIIISARPIPGNEKALGGVIDELLKRGCEVVYESMYDLHVSGHACQEELKMMQYLTKPKYFIPVHGEQKHLMKHAKLANDMGIPEENIFIGDIGNCVEINEDFIKKCGNVPAGTQLVDGLGVGDVGAIVLRDRKLLSEDGIIIAVCTLDYQTKDIISGPDIISRGFVYVRESEDMMEEARRIAENAIYDCVDGNIHEWNAIKVKVRESLARYFYEKTKRSPMILPIIMEA